MYQLSVQVLDGSQWLILNRRKYVAGHGLYLRKELEELLWRWRISRHFGYAPLRLHREQLA